MKKFENWIIIYWWGIWLFIIIVYLYFRMKIVEKKFTRKRFVKKENVDKILIEIMNNKKLFDEKTWNEVYNIIWRNTTKNKNLRMIEEDSNKLYEILVIRLKVILNENY